MTPENRAGRPLDGWTLPPAPLRETLAGRWVVVEPLSAERHGADLWAAFSEDSAGLRWSYRFDGPFPDETACRGYLARMELSPTLRFGAYRDRATGRVAGMGALMSIVPAAGSIEIGAIMMAPAMAGTRAGTEALFLQIDWAFRAGYRRMEWTCDPLNAPSMRAAERLGFSYEATFRQAYVSKGRNRDKACFAITDGDWPAIRAAMEDWLAPENFDPEGRQRRPLRGMTAPLVRVRAEPAAAPERDVHNQPADRAVPGWTARPHPVRRSMAGRLCRLEPLTVDHAGALHAANCEDRRNRIWDWLPYGPYATPDAYADWVGAMTLDRDPLFFAILVGGRPVGIASYLRIDPGHGSIEVGHINFSPLLQKTPAATEAMYLMMKWAFEAGYRRYEWKCNALNAGSRAAAQRYGLSYEGVFRQATVSKGQNRDTAWYAAIDSEWPAIRTAFETWLDPANFDAQGRQRQRLSDLTAPVLVARG